jgi:hypothetical protein
MYATRARGGAKLNPRFAQIALQPFRNMARQRTARGDGVLKISKRYRHVATFNVRFGSKADIGLPAIDVRFTPNSGHRSARWHYQLCAKGGFMQYSNLVVIRSQTLRNVAARQEENQ